MGENKKAAYGRTYDNVPYQICLVNIAITKLPCQSNLVLHVMNVLLYLVLGYLLALQNLDLQSFKFSDFFLYIL